MASKEIFKVVIASVLLGAKFPERIKVAAPNERQPDICNRAYRS